MTPHVANWSAATTDSVATIDGTHCVRNSLRQPATQSVSASVARSWRHLWEITRLQQDLHTDPASRNAQRNFAPAIQTVLPPDATTPSAATTSATSIPIAAKSVGTRSVPMVLTSSVRRTSLNAALFSTDPASYRTRSHSVTTDDAVKTSATSSRHVVNWNGMNCAWKQPSATAPSVVMSMPAAASLPTQLRPATTKSAARACAKPTPSVAPSPGTPAVQTSPCPIPSNAAGRMHVAIHLPAAATSQAISLDAAMTSAAGKSAKASIHGAAKSGGTLSAQRRP